MPLSTNSLIDLVPDRPVAGGRMLARHEGRVILVAGAIPGERVRARIQRVSRHVAWADVVDVMEPSADRREPAGDPACGGCLYAHIDYTRQLQLKRDVITDAFRRIGKMTVESSFDIAASQASGYRLRARLHVRGGRAGFVREGTHDLCDAAASGQLLSESLLAVQAVVAFLGDRAHDCSSLVIAENIAATERVVHLEPRAPARLDDIVAFRRDVAGVTGISTEVGGGIAVLRGRPTVTDTAADLFGGESPIGDSAVWTRHASSFFQGNRFLAGALVRRVLALSPGERFVDLYAGVGLFAVALAARGGRVLACEGDRSSGADLANNAAPWIDRLEPVTTSVEHAVARPLPFLPDVVVLDPPRTGMSPDALRGLLAWRAPRVVYVSCDPPTLARDAARLVAGGYALQSIDAFDLFPNTPHVETIAVFDRSNSNMKT